MYTFTKLQLSLRENLSQISCFCGDKRKVVSPRKSIFKQLDTVLVGVVRWVTIRYCASGRGALGYRKFINVFCENLFSNNWRVFSCEISLL